jgi:hypothetical protein
MRWRFAGGEGRRQDWQLIRLQGTPCRFRRESQAAIFREALMPVAEFARAAKSRWRESDDARRPEHYRYE